jgi:hypothetical protein
MAQVIVEHIGADQDALCRLRGADQGRHRRHPRGEEVVGQHQARIAEILDLACLGDAFGARGRVPDTYTETEGVHGRHSVRPDARHSVIS